MELLSWKKIAWTSILVLIFYIFVLFFFFFCFPFGIFTGLAYSMVLFEIPSLKSLKKILGTIDSLYFSYQHTWSLHTKSMHSIWDSIWQCCSFAYVSSFYQSRKGWWNSGNWELSTGCGKNPARQSIKTLPCLLRRNPLHGEEAMLDSKDLLDVRAVVCIFPFTSFICVNWFCWSIFHLKFYPTRGTGY